MFNSKVRINESKCGLLRLYLRYTIGFKKYFFPSLNFMLIEIDI